VKTTKFLFTFELNDGQTGVDSLILSIRIIVLVAVEMIHNRWQAKDVWS
jgi:hypothetical protein